MSNEKYAANKAAEEGELPALPFPVLHHIPVSPGLVRNGYSDEQVREYARQAIAADRAARPVANKAEVDLRGLPSILREASNILAGSQEMRFPITDELDGFASMIEHSTPPATTGASTDLADMETRKDAAYYERNQVVAALAKCFPSGVAKTAIEGWSEDWHGCVYIDLPTGQASWHFHDSHAHLFDGLPAYVGGWDGHSTDEKYARLAALKPVGASTACYGASKPEQACPCAECKAEAGASTVLTDERITDTALQHAAGSMDGHWCFKHKSLLDFAREVAAQAGQVAVPEILFDGLRDFLAPSPAKESK